MAICIPRLLLSELPVIEINLGDFIIGVNYGGFLEVLRVGSGNVGVALLKLGLYGAYTSLQETINTFSKSINRRSNDLRVSGWARAPLKQIMMYKHFTTIPEY